MGIRVLNIFLFVLLSLLSPVVVYANNNADTNNSTITVNTGSIPADGSTTATISIVVKDGSGNVLPGDHVMLVSTNDPGLSINGSLFGTNSLTGATDSNGSVVFTVKSNNQNPITDTFTASDVSNSPPVPLGSSGGKVTVAFTASSSKACPDGAPGSAPRLISAIASGNTKIILKWASAADPVSHYLLAFGTKTGQYIYGNPNIGPKGTTAFTVDNLINGRKYFFVVRAVNGCAPGSYSNELSAVVGGIIRLTSAPVKTNTPTPMIINNDTVQESPTAIPTIQPTETPIPKLTLIDSVINSKFTIFGLIIIIILCLIIIFWQKFKMNKKETKISMGLEVPEDNSTPFKS
jgi:hypothetical protein